MRRVQGVNVRWWAEMRPGPGGRGPVLQRLRGHLRLSFGSIPMMIDGRCRKLALKCFLLYENMFITLHLTGVSGVDGRFKGIARFTRNACAINF